MVQNGTFPDVNAMNEASNVTTFPLDVVKCCFNFLANTVMEPRGTSLNLVSTFSDQRWRERLPISTPIYIQNLKTD